MSNSKGRMKDRECALEDCFAIRATGYEMNVCMLLSSSYPNYEICPFYKSKANADDKYIDFCRQADRETYDYAENKIGELREKIRAKEEAIRTMRKEVENDRGRLLGATKAKARLIEQIEREKRKNGL